MPFELSDFDMYGTPPATATDGMLPDPKATPKMGVNVVNPDSGHYATCYCCGLSLSNLPPDYVVRRYREYAEYGKQYAWGYKMRSYVISLCWRCDSFFPGPRTYVEPLR